MKRSRLHEVFTVPPRRVLYILQCVRADSISAVFFELFVPREHVRYEVTPNNIEMRVWCNTRSRSSVDDSLDVHYFMVIFCFYSLFQYNIVTRLHESFKR